MQSGPNATWLSSVIPLSSVHAVAGDKALLQAAVKRHLYAAG